MRRRAPIPWGSAPAAFFGRHPPHPVASHHILTCFGAAPLASGLRPSQKAAMLHINDLTYRLGERLLIDNATVALPSGARVGLVGRNGAGKTTLFRLIANEISPESGSISLPR